MGINWNHWESLAIIGNQCELTIRICLESLRILCLESLGIIGNQWESMGIIGNNWESMGINGNQWELTIRIGLESLRIPCLESLGITGNEPLGFVWNHWESLEMNHSHCRHRYSQALQSGILPYLRHLTGMKVFFSTGHFKYDLKLCTLIQ